MGKLPLILQYLREHGRERFLDEAALLCKCSTSAHAEALPCEQDSDQPGQKGWKSRLVTFRWPSIGSTLKELTSGIRLTSLFLLPYLVQKKPVSD